MGQAGRAGGERDEARHRAALAEAQVRSLEERRTALERDLREREAALAAARVHAERDAAAREAARPAAGPREEPRRAVDHAATTTSR